MAQNADRKPHEPASDVALTSHALDLVPLFDSPAVDAEVEADVIRGLLDANGIPSVVKRPGPYPSLGFQVLVPRGKLLEARKLVEEARAAGPEAATEAELDSESNA